MNEGYIVLPLKSIVVMPLGIFTDFPIETTFPSLINKVPFLITKSELIKMVAFLNATIVFFDVFTPVFIGKYSCAFVRVTIKSINTKNSFFILQCFIFINLLRT